MSVLSAVAVLVGDAGAAPARLPGPVWEGLYQLVGGTALFLLGLHMAGDGLRKSAGGRMRAVFGKLAHRRAAGFGAGLLVTVLLQSSSATTVLLVGMADAGLLTAVQSGALILGADMGTTLVPQLLAFRVAEWGLLGVAAGFLLVVAGRWQAWRSLGWALSGLGLLFYGMHVMGLGVEPIRQHPAVAAQLAGLAEDPWLAFGAATLLTAVIQSSGATVALAMALTAQGALDVSAALPIVVGANVGTCATAVLAALGAGREGRRVAAVHLGFKLLAALLVMPFAGPLGRLMTDLLGGAGAGPERAVASVHTVFNVTLAVLFLPVCSRLAGLLGRLVPRGPGGTERIRSTLVSSLAGTPAVALMAAERVLSGMGQRCAAMLRLMLDAMEDDSGHKVERAVRADDEVDAIYSGLSGGLARLSQGGLSRDSAARQGRIMYAAKLFEEAGDLVSQDLGKLAERLERDGLSFSMGAMANLRRFGRAAADGLERAARAAAGEANPCAPDDGAVEREHRELLAAHFDQLARGVTDAGLTGSIYPDALAVLRDIRLVTVGIERALAEPSGDGGPAGRQEKGAG